MLLPIEFPEKVLELLEDVPLNFQGEAKDRLLDILHHKTTITSKEDMKKRAYNQGWNDAIEEVHIDLPCEKYPAGM